MHLSTVYRFPMRAEANTPTRLRSVAHRRTQTHTPPKFRFPHARGSLIIQSVYSFIKYTNYLSLTRISGSKCAHLLVQTTLLSRDAVSCQYDYSYGNVLIRVNTRNNIVQYRTVRLNTVNALVRSHLSRRH